MAITLNTLVYNQDSFVSADKVSYAGPSNTFQVKDLVILGRIAPKPTATYEGKAKSSMKRVKTVTLPNGKKDDIIIEMTVSVPVGALAADVDALRDDLGDLAISATGQSLVNTHKLNF